MADTFNIIVDQGSTKTLEWTILDENDDELSLDGYSAELQVRKNYDSKSSLLQYDEEFVLSSGKATLVVSDTDTNTISFEGRRLVCVYDLELVSPGGQRVRIAEGKFFIHRNITR